MADDSTSEHREEKRGRPGKATRYRSIAHQGFSVTAHVDQEAVAYDAASDGCLPFVTNDTRTPAELLRTYRFQPPSSAATRLVPADKPTCALEHFGASRGPVE